MSVGLEVGKYAVMRSDVRFYVVDISFIFAYVACMVMSVGLRVGKYADMRSSDEGY